MKGFAYSLEALIAIGVILITAITLFGGLGISEPGRGLKDLGDRSLKGLDSAGLLREYALSQDSTSVISQLSDIIPVILNYNVSFCRATCTDIATPKDRNVFTSFYYYSGAPGNYTPTEVVLYIWEK